MSFCVNFPLFSVVACLIFSVVSGVLPGKYARALSLSLTAIISAPSAVLLIYIVGSDLRVAPQNNTVAAHSVRHKK